MEIFKSKPDIKKLYTNPLGFAYESHLGPVYCVDFNPFFKNYFLSGFIIKIKIYKIKTNYNTNIYLNLFF
jgi:hypothetical protein